MPMNVKCLRAFAGDALDLFRGKILLSPAWICPRQSPRFRKMIAIFIRNTQRRTEGRGLEPVRSQALISKTDHGCSFASIGDFEICPPPWEPSMVIMEMLRGWGNSTQRTG